MTLLHISPSYKPAYYYGGPTVSVSQLCETLVKINHTVEVLTTTANGDVELQVPVSAPQQVEGVSIRYCPRWTGDHGHFSPTLLFHLWRSCHKYDLIHIHSWWNWVAILAVGICRFRHIRPVVSPRGMLSPYTMQSPLKRIFHRLLGNALLRGVVLHVTSVQEQQEAAQLAPGAPAFCLPNLVQLPAVPLYPAVQNKACFNILFLSRIDPKKRLELLFEALSGLGIPYRLTIAGAGEPDYVERLRSMAQNLGIAAHIDWVGWVEAAKKAALLAAADVFVLPSHNENFANAALEALAMGTPVLLTDTVGLAEYVRQTGFGRVCPPDAAVIAADLADLYVNGCGFGREAIAQQVRRDFEPLRLAQAYVEAYQKLAAYPKQD